MQSSPKRFVCIKRVLSLADKHVQSIVQLYSKYNYVFALECCGRATKWAEHASPPAWVDFFIAAAHGESGLSDGVQ